MIEVDDTNSGAGDATAAAAQRRARGAETVTAKAREGETVGARDANDSLHDAAGEDAHATAAATSRATQAASSSYIRPLVLHRGLRASSKDHYHVEELSQYHDRQFVENTYRAILRRSPSDEEGARTLEELRGGRASKVEIIERVWSSAEAQAGGAGRVSLEGLPSPLMRRLSALPVVGYLLRVLRALVRLPVFMQHQQQFEAYALAQQQLIADHVNQFFAPAAFEGTASDEGDAPRAASAVHLSHSADVIETVAMFSDALIELSNGHAELQMQTQTQAEQTQAALADLTQAITAQQQITETLGREQQKAFDAQQEFLIQEQRVIVE
ncbi:MAG TPA: hypothetical protein VK363_13905, partial [Pyrinomonadaceae bacterium]|nr:hypothetical protein [Pyrinomonadaceae bacterium]